MEGEFKQNAGGAYGLSAHPESHDTVNIEDTFARRAAGDRPYGSWVPNQPHPPTKWDERVSETFTTAAMPRPQLIVSPLATLEVHPELRPLLRHILGETRAAISFQ
jgi:hypothetical protein